MTHEDEQAPPVMTPDRRVFTAVTMIADQFRTVDSAAFKQLACTVHLDRIPTATATFITIAEQAVTSTLQGHEPPPPSTASELTRITLFAADLACQIRRDAEREDSPAVRSGVFELLVAALTALAAVRGVEDGSVVAWVAVISKRMATL